MNMFKPNIASSPEEYLMHIDDPRRTDLQKLHTFITRTVPKLEVFMISGMVGYGRYHYKYASGKEGEWCIIGLASQKNYISLYVCAYDEQGYIAEKYKSKLPKASIGKSCIRFKKLEDIDLDVLKEILTKGTKLMKQA